MVPIVTTLFSSEVCWVKSTVLFGSYSESTVPVEGVVDELSAAGAAEAEAEVEGAAEEELLLHEANVKIRATARRIKASFFIPSSDIYIII